MHPCAAAAELVAPSVSENGRRPLDPLTNAYYCYDMTTTQDSMRTTMETTLADQINDELARLGAGSTADAQGIDARVDGTIATVWDTQETAMYDAAEALSALHAVPICHGYDSGFEAAWNALAALVELQADDSSVPPSMAEEES